MGGSFQVDFSPHFVYNTLNCAISLCRHAPDKTSELLIAFAECLHYSETEMLQQVTLEHELEFISNYLFIQSIRFDSRITYILDIDESIQMDIPRFLIYEGVKQVLEKEIESSREAFVIRVKLESLQSTTASVWINDQIRWETEL
jgi:LytS/YehU family sensor histidine kinase